MGEAKPPVLLLIRLIEPPSLKPIILILVFFSPQLSSNLSHSIKQWRSSNANSFLHCSFQYSVLTRHEGWRY
jgi:hypothetical protein